MQEPNWSYDLGPWYEGGGAEALCGLRIQLGGGGKHTRGDEAQLAGPTGASTQSKALHEQESIFGIQQ